MERVNLIFCLEAERRGLPPVESKQVTTRGPRQVVADETSIGSFDVARNCRRFTNSFHAGDGRAVPLLKLH